MKATKSCQAINRYTHHFAFSQSDPEPPRTDIQDRKDLVCQNFINVKANNVVMTLKDGHHNDVVTCEIKLRVY